jgi:hypothetical protein
MRVNEYENTCMEIWFLSVLSKNVRGDYLFVKKLTSVMKKYLYRLLITPNRLTMSRYIGL